MTSASGLSYWDAFLPSVVIVALGARDPSVG